MPDRSVDARRLLDLVRSLPDSERPAFLDDLDRRDTALRTEVEALLRQETRPRSPTRTGSGRSRIPLPLAVGGAGALLTAGLAVSLAWILGSIEANFRESRTRDLKGVLSYRTASLQSWAEHQKDRFRALAALPDLVRHAKVLIDIAERSDRIREEVLASPSYAPFENLLRGLPDDLAGVGTGLVSPSGSVLLLEGGKLISVQVAPDAGSPWRRTLLGEVVILKPYRERNYVTGGVPAFDRPILSLGGPLRDEQGKVFAILALRFAAERTFDGMFAAGPFGETGDVLAFDKKGVLLNEPVDSLSLRNLGLLPKETNGAATHLVLRDPGRELAPRGPADPARDEWPPTRMVQSAIQGNSGIDANGYRSFRGREVLGAWTWLPDWEMGVAAEVDVRDVLQPLAPVRRTFQALVGVAALATLLLALAGHRLELHRRARGQEVFGAYTLERLIGRGGMGEIYLARHATLQRPTALKIMKGDASGPEVVSRFEREAKLASQLVHPNTIQVFDYGETPDGRFYYAMEYLEGLNLAQLVSVAGPLPAARAIHLLAQVCSSLEEAHAAGLVHRDIKPGNVMVCRRGGLADVVKVLDFGIARSLAEGSTLLTQPGLVSGTPVYIAPERIQEPQLADARSDLYSLGALAFYLLTGRDVYEGAGPTEVLYQVMSSAPPSPSRLRGTPLPDELERLVLQCLAKEPAARPPSARDVRERLLAVKTTTPWTDRDAEAWWTENDEGLRRSSPA